MRYKEGHFIIHQNDVIILSVSHNNFKVQEEKVNRTEKSRQICKNSWKS